MRHYFLLTIDVEDWFQVENFKKYIPFASWSSYELRVEKNTHRLLDLLDSYYGQRTMDHRQKKTSYQPAAKSYELGCQGNPKATFFVLGWLAERLPHLVREIHSRGHEIASHGYYHNLCNEQCHEDLKTDLCDSKSLLEDIIGNQVYGYRAPSFAINNDILKIIEDCGYLYDSSYNSFAMHGRYGQVSLSRNGTTGIAFQIPTTRNPDFIGKHATRNTQHEFFYELPISNLHFRTPFSYACPARPVAPEGGTGVKFFKKDSKADLSAGSLPAGRQAGVEDLTGALSLPRETRSMFHWGAISSEQNRGGFVLPWGGGGYFRLIPFPLFKIGIKRILGQEKAYLFYFHPWEIDPEQPRVHDASTFYRFRHYSNLSKTHSKLLKLIENFVHCNFITCRQYLDEI